MTTAQLLEIIKSQKEIYTTDFNTSKTVNNNLGIKFSLQKIEVCNELLNKLVHTEMETNVFELKNLIEKEWTLLQYIKENFTEEHPAVSMIRSRWAMMTDIELLITERSE
jgi:hypothetical protein